MDNGEVMLTTIFYMVIALFLGWVIFAPASPPSVDYKELAVENGCAAYNPRDGKFTWKNDWGK